MKIAVHSDLHMEFFGLDEAFLEDQDFDVLVLAGDISVQSLLHIDLSYITDRCSKPIIFVAGNHDYYNGDHDEENIRRICDMHGIHFLNRDMVTIGDIDFYGATGYTTLDALDSDRIRQVDYAIADFKFDPEWRVENHIAEGHKDEQFFVEASKSDRRKVFVSHFPPFMELAHPEFPYSILTEYFNNSYDIEKFEHLPELCISGHTHHNFNKIIRKRNGDGVWCSANQRGYPGEIPDYDPNLIIEI